MSESLMAGVAAFVLALLIGAPVVARLRALHLGKAISELGPSSHATKAGTPTMGGVLIFAAVAVVTVAVNRSGGAAAVLVLAVVAVTMAIGIADDFGTLVGRRSAGLSWRLKVALLTVMALLVAWVLHDRLDRSFVHVPLGETYELGLVFIPLAAAVLVATTTSVAITDGLDGLLGGTAAIAFVAYGVIAYVEGQPFLSTFAFTVVGALMGFLWFNANPARVFMGDAGALPLGAALATIALLTGHWLLLPIIGVVFVLNAVSDLLQIAYFQTTGGRRLFRMAPLHNHFELVGWPEQQIVARFWLLGFAGALAGLAIALAM
jgi:phospho-N-acetylmuramoyl-pentapeptide-transferase